MPAKRYDMVLEMGVDFRRQFNFDVNLLRFDRGLLDYDVRMQIRDKPDGRIVADFSKSDGEVVTTHSRVYLMIPNSAVFDLTGLQSDYVTEPLPSLDNPTTVYNKYGVYDLLLIAPDGIIERELYGKVVFVDLISE